MEKVLSDKKMIALFVLPAFIVFISIFLIPVIISFALSLTNWNGVGMPEFIGIKNYKYISLKGLEFLGVEVDREANNVRGKVREISKPGCKVKAFVIPTNEELMIARDTLELIQK